MHPDGGEWTGKFLDPACEGAILWVPGQRAYVTSQLVYGEMSLPPDTWMDMSCTIASQAVCIIRPDGQREQLPGWNWEPACVSPDGTGIAGIAEGRRLVINGKCISDDFDKVWGPIWAPGGESIVFRGVRTLGGVGLYRIAIDGSRCQRIMKPMSYATFTPQGNAFVAMEDTIHPGPKSILRVALRTGDTYVIAHGTHGMEAMQLSPDGRRVAFVRHKDSRIIVVGIDGLVESELNKGSSIAWSPDGGELAYGRDGHIYIIDVRTRIERRIARGWNPVWSR